MEDIMNFCEDLGEAVVDVIKTAARYLKSKKKWIKTQLEALPYILAACLVCGAFWFITSMLAIMCEY